LSLRAAELQNQPFLQRQEQLVQQQVFLLLLIWLLFFCGVYGDVCSGGLQRGLSFRVCDDGISFRGGGRI